MKSIKDLGHLLLFLLLICYAAWSQEDIVSFKYPDIKVSITPEFPAFCNKDKELELKSNEDFQNYNHINL